MGFQIVLATVPDLITMVVLETGEPISSDELRFGLRVAVVVLPASPLLTTPQALKVSTTREIDSPLSVVLGFVLFSVLFPFR